MTGEAEHYSFPSSVTFYICVFWNWVCVVNIYAVPLMPFVCLECQEQTDDFKKIFASLPEAAGFLTGMAAAMPNDSWNILSVLSPTITRLDTHNLLARTYFLIWSLI